MQPSMVPLLVAAALLYSSQLACCQVQLANQVAYAAPSNQSNQDQQAAPCPSPCWVVESRFPFQSCKATCEKDLCGRGYNVYQSRDVCCSPGVSFPDGCTTRPRECWVVESFNLRTCVRDDRKCLQGYGVYASEAACCAPSTAFPNGCANITLAAQPCWVVDTYWPTRQCRESRTLCATDSGAQSFGSKEACCTPKSGAFDQGCSTSAPQTPCWMVNNYYPNRDCIQSSDPAVCNRGWSVFQSQEICCAPGAGFQEGCTTVPGGGGNTNAAGAATLPAGAVAAGQNSSASMAIPMMTQPVTLPAGAQTTAPGNLSMTPTPAAAPVPASFVSTTPLPTMVNASDIPAVPALNASG